MNNQEFQLLAKSSRLYFSEWESKYAQKEIQQVLDYSSEIVKNTQIEVVQRPQQEMCLREDVASTLGSGDILAIAPRVEDSYFVVPVIISQ